MKRIITVVLTGLLISNQSCVNNSKNISIQNEELEGIIGNFRKRSSVPIQRTAGFISVSVWIEAKDTTIGVYANKFLKPEFFVGETEHQGFRVFFYSNIAGSIDGLYSTKEYVITNTAATKNDTYTEFYRLESGRLSSLPRAH